MSQQAVELVKEQLKDKDKADFDDMVELIISEAGVAEKTAAAYIYDASALRHEWTADGEHIVREADEDELERESVVEGFDGRAAELEMEPGEPTGDKYEFLDVLEDVDHPLVPEQSTYYRRRLEGHKSDIQVYTYDMASDTPAGTQHVLLTGPPGVGKNAAVRDICANTNRPMIVIPVGGGIRYEDLVGHYSPTAEGELDWTDGVLTTAARYGWTVVLDEVDMMSGDVSSPLHQVTQGEGSQELIIRQTGEVVNPHPQFRVVATRNRGLAGSKQVNPAFLSRFSEHEVGYLPTDAEINVLTSQVDGLTEGEIKPVVEYAGELRDRHPQEVSFVVTTRDLKRIGDYIAGGLFDQKAALRKVLLPRADPDMDRDPISDEIDMKF